MWPTCFDGIEHDDELVGDLPVRIARGYQFEHLDLSGGEQGDSSIKRTDGPSGRLAGRRGMWYDFVGEAMLFVPRAIHEASFEHVDSGRSVGVAYRPVAASPTAR